MAQHTLSRRTANADRYTVDDLINIARISNARKVEAAQHLRDQLPWLKYFLTELHARPKPAEFNGPLERLAKKASAAASELRRLEQQYTLQHNALTKGANESRWAAIYDIGGRLDALAKLAQRAKMPRGKQRDLARYSAVQFAYGFFVRFSPIKPSYAASNALIEFSEALWEIVIGGSAEMTTYARIIIREARGAEPYAEYD